MRLLPEETRFAKNFQIFLPNHLTVGGYSPYVSRLKWGWRKMGPFAKVEQDGDYFE